MPLKIGVLCCGLLLLPLVGRAGAEVQLRIEDGRVSLNATNATVRDILAEWARIGQTRIVNGDRMPGGPISIQLDGVTEEQALEIILRSAAGYVTAPRATAIANASRYDRILVMPTSTPTRAAAPQPTFNQPGMPQQFPQQPPPGFPGAFRGDFPGQAPPFPPRPVDDDDGDADVQDDPAPNVVLPNPGFNPAAPMPQQPPIGGTFGIRPVPGQQPVGVPAPGMVVPTPPQQQQNAPGMPTPVRPQEPF
jgi:hypothetical protein